jgi:hypothetical protein
MIAECSDLYQWRSSNMDFESECYPGQVYSAIQQVRSEADVALRILREFSKDSQTPGMAEYVGQLEALLQRIETLANIPPARIALGIVNGLQLARSRLEEAIPNASTWLRLARAVDPERVGPTKIPARFVRSQPAGKEPPMVLTAADIAVSRALSAFLGSDANTGSSAS